MAGCNVFSSVGVPDGSWLFPVFNHLLRVERVGNFPVQTPCKLYRGVPRRRRNSGRPTGRVISCELTEKRKGQSKKVEGTKRKDLRWKGY